MKKLHFSAIADALFSGFAVFLIGFTVYNMFAQRKAALICAVLTAIPAIICTFVFTTKRLNKKLCSAAAIPDRENLFFYLGLRGDKQLFLKLFAALGIAAVNRREGVFLTDKGCYFYPFFGFDGLKKSDVAAASKRAHGKPFIIAAPVFDSGMCAFIALFEGAEILDGDGMFELFKKADMLPERKKIPKMLWKDRFSAAKKRVFVKKRAPKYFLFGLTFLLFSFLVPYKVYYIIFGTVLMLLSLSCLFMGAQTVNQNSICLISREERR